MVQKLIAVLSFAALGSLGFAQARHRVVVELDTSGQLPYGSALNNVENLKKAFKNDAVEIEVVCHGAGIDLLFANKNPLAPRIKKLQQNGVAFAACSNTLKNRKIGKDRLFPFVQIVDSGTAEVIRKQESGWTYLHR